MPLSPRAAQVLRFLSIIAVFLGAVYFRYTGLMWGEYEYQHPDERFLVWVVADIASVEQPGDYFNTAISTLNPANRGHAFYVYGDLPVIVARYAAEAAFDLVGWQEILQVGRGLSALVDLLTVLLVWSMAERLFGWRIGLLAGLFSAAAVLQIQQAHFFTVDSFATFFSTLAIYLAVRLVTEDPEKPVTGWALLFGAAVGLAMACKVNTFVVAGLLPLALAARWLRGIEQTREQTAVTVGYRYQLGSAWRFVLVAIAAGVVAFLVFRVAQPYAFRGPGFFNMLPDPAWLQSIREQRAQATGDVDFPPALQWARRPIWFSFQNLTIWGLGLPLGILSWVGVVWYGWTGIRHIRKGHWQDLLHPVWAAGLLLWLWTVGYFAWQTSAWNATMRYQLPIYPSLVIFAAWVAVDVKNRFLTGAAGSQTRWEPVLRAGVGIVLVLTLAWAFAFTRMYNRPETRAEASRWILDNVPGPVNLNIVTAEGSFTQRLPLIGQISLRANLPSYVSFQWNDAGGVDALILGSVQVSSLGGGGTIVAEIIEPAQPGVILLQGTVAFPVGGAENLEIPLVGQGELPVGNYLLRLTSSVPENDAGALVSIGGTTSLRFYRTSTAVTGSPTSDGLAGFYSGAGGTLRRVLFGSSPAANFLPSNATLLLMDPQSGEQFTSLAQFAGGDQYNLVTPIPLRAGVEYTAALVTETSITNFLPVEPVFLIQDGASQVWLTDLTTAARVDDPIWIPFTPQTQGALAQLTIGFAAQVDPSVGASMVVARLLDPNNPAQSLAEARGQIELPEGDPRGSKLRLTFDPPLPVAPGQTYTLTLAPDAGQLAIHGAAPANETSWDMALPFRMKGYDPYGGIYRGDLNFEMYWDDTEEKRARFYSILDQTDYIFISSNRQWGTTTRIPERYPLTTTYYRALLGCPLDQDILWCYNTAEVGTHTGTLGFELVEVFTSYPNLGPLQINTQFAEEAFTVYDHPKVFIFRKTAGYDPARIRELLGAVDLRNVIHLTPRKAADFKDMLLSDAQWQRLQQGGTWASLFPPDSPLNRSQPIAVAALYGVVTLLAWLAFPVLRVAMPNLPDRGYGVARIAALLLLAFGAWALGSLNVAVTRPVLWLISGALMLVGLAFAWVEFSALRADLRLLRGQIVRVEVLALVLFAAALAFRYGNPDLWHPIFGGEKPMDFSHFNAILKSGIFPPYDPWFAGGALNYYYFGYVFAGMPVKLLGIMPSVAYNLVMPLLFCMVGVAAFSIGWNLLSVTRREPGEKSQFDGRTLAAAAGVSFFLLLGNLGTVRMLWQGAQQVAQPGASGGEFFQQSQSAVRGVLMLLRGDAERMPYYTSDWYWKPSRAIQPEAGNEITEFPLFTFLYGDLHAHWMALPLTLLALAWCLNMVLDWPIAKRRLLLWLRWGSTLLLGALVVGALRPANTWDQYTYLALACIATFFGISRYARGKWRWGLALLSAVVLAGLALLLYRPFSVWFGQAYNQLTPYTGQKTNLGSYLVHWGLFLFVIVTWLLSELIRWMQDTPVSSLRRLRIYPESFALSAFLILLGLGILLWQGVKIALIAAPVGMLAAFLLLLPNQAPVKRFVLFMIGTAMALTIGVELVAVQGDLSRMNTVFKFYYQAWTMLSISAAAALGLLFRERPRWQNFMAWLWRAALALMLIGAALYPLMAVRAKLADRMTPSAPRSLDGMEFMAFSRYGDGPTPETYTEIELIEDYYAIRWVQENVSGSPVIVEANTPEYRHWGSRFTIYTGLPGVVGWNWHERQQRALTPDTWVYNRISDIHSFYRTTDRERAAAFLNEYEVGLIVVGQLERIYYPGEGLEKFAQFDGDLWHTIYTEGATTIYAVNR